MNIMTKNDGYLVDQMFSRDQLVSFGNYLLSDARRNKYKYARLGVPLKERLGRVYDADIANWMDETYGNDAQKTDSFDQLAVKGEVTVFPPDNWDDLIGGEG